MLRRAYRDMAKQAMHAWRDGGCAGRMLRGARNKACNAGKASPGVRGVSQRRLWWTTAASSTARPQQAALEDVTTPSLPDAANGVEDDAGLSLTVSSPALLLNHMAERYSSTPRVLMEFVDNALDDADDAGEEEKLGC